MTEHRAGQRAPPASATSPAHRKRSEIGSAARDQLGYLLAPETLLYGPMWGVVKNLLRNPVPHDPQSLWEGLQRPLPPSVRWLSEHYPPYPVRRLLLRRKLRQAHQKGIAEHYDVSNDFYRLFLDQRFQFYSCADFEAPGETLEQAQENKANFLLRLIDPQPGERILDLGCGWGGMLRHIAEFTGEPENLLGYTLSREQFLHLQEGDGPRVEFENFITVDYHSESFHKIYAIGAWEHVRRDDLAPLLGRIYAALRPGGRFVNHFFTSLTDGYHAWELAAQLYFPGSHPPAHPSQVRAFEAAGFHIRSRSTHDYRPTLRAWYERLAANQRQAIELVGLQTYNRYLVFFASAWRLFDEGKFLLVRYVLEKPGPARMRGTQAGVHPVRNRITAQSVENRNGPQKPRGRRPPK